MVSIVVVEILDVLVPVVLVVHLPSLGINELRLVHEVEAGIDTMGIDHSRHGNNVHRSLPDDQASSLQGLVPAAVVMELGYQSIDKPILQPFNEPWRATEARLYHPKVLLILVDCKEVGVDANSCRLQQHPVAKGLEGLVVNTGVELFLKLLGTRHPSLEPGEGISWVPMHEPLVDLGLGLGEGKLLVLSWAALFLGSWPLRADNWISSPLSAFIGVA